jgi:ribosome-associated translation inhibitor RaiA
MLPGRREKPMQAPLRIAFHGVDGSDAARKRIEEKVAWLERFYDRITGCRVVVQVPHRHHLHGNRFQVRIDLTVPGGKIAVNRELAQRTGSRDLSAAIQHAFEAARRRLEEHVRRLRKEVKSHEPPARVNRLLAEEGSGLQETADGREVSFQRNAGLNGDSAHLQVGAEVSIHRSHESTP